jgi:hypothetical protein
LREAPFQHLGNPSMELLPLGFDERVIGGVLDQGMFEDVLAAWRPAHRLHSRLSCTTPVCFLKCIAHTGHETRAK